VHDATGVWIEEGEMAVFTPRGDNRFTRAGRLVAGGPPR
jgi:hypothetical protein